MNSGVKRRSLVINQAMQESIWSPENASPQKNIGSRGMQMQKSKSGEAFLEHHNRKPMSTTDSFHGFKPVDKPKPQQVQYLKKNSDKEIDRGTFQYNLPTQLSKHTVPIVKGNQQPLSFPSSTSGNANVRMVIPPVSPTKKHVIGTPVKKSRFPLASLPTGVHTEAHHTYDQRSSKMLPSDCIQRVGICERYRKASDNDTVWGKSRVGNIGENDISERTALNIEGKYESKWDWESDGDGYIYDAY
jgi:hypothetical protein